MQTEQAYVVISPVKDEAKYITMTLDSMAQQHIPPAQWVIVNDGSTDATEAIVSQYAQTHPWIKLVNRQTHGPRRRGRGVIEAFYDGFNAVDVPYDFVVKLDGDVSFGPDYFEGILRGFAADPKLGVAGGALYERPDEKTWKLFTVPDTVRGATKVYRRACFEAIGGLCPSMGWDGIDEWKARSLGWKVHSFLDLKLLHYRFTGKGSGFKSFAEQGEGAYRMGYHPLYITARCVRRMGDKPYILGGLGMFWGYIKAVIKKEELLADPSVVRYIRRTQMASLGRMVMGKSGSTQ